MKNKIFRKKSIENLKKESESADPLKRVLSVKDLTFMGLAAVLGAGIFSTIGSAAYLGGPGVSTLFIITAITCGFTASCYAGFASRIPVSGSAYTYSYVAFGEVVAWIIGWALILEYSIRNIVVAISWRDRKSTRLNSSHVAISYAVFCLKKKKNENKKYYCN